jgi:hypothetical protein
MLSKSLDQWIQEAREYSRFYYERYANMFDDRGCPDNTRKHYCEVSQSYWKLYDVLIHIKRYGSPYNKDKCSACNHDKKHVQEIFATYQRYERWIKNLAPSKLN